MKKTILALVSIVAAAFSMYGEVVSSSSLEQRGDMLDVNIKFDVQSLKVKSCETVLLTPMLVTENDTIGLPDVALCGRRSYLQYRRHNLFGYSMPDSLAYVGETGDTYIYKQTLPVRASLDEAQLTVGVRRYGCGHRPVDDGSLLATGNRWVNPTIDLANMEHYVRPAAEIEKVRTLSGRANVEFPVNRTILLEDFRNNFPELASIRAGIDSVKNDKDVTINNISIHGFASPEGPYDNNVRLAKGRTEAVKDYVKNLYALSDRLLTTTHTPEDWEGLEEWVVGSNISSRDGILAIIRDESLAPDARDQKLKQNYPKEYETLLNMVYPSLRHTDYKIEYTVRSYIDPKEILEVMHVRPGNLSLDELYVAASSLEPGSPEFNEVFDIAVRLHPESAEANLNAANAALAAGDINSAEKYLEKAGDTPQADYARALLALKKNELGAAMPLLKRAADNGIADADALLAKATKIYESQKTNTY